MQIAHLGPMPRANCSYFFSWANAPSQMLIFLFLGQCPEPMLVSFMSQCSGPNAHCVTLYLFRESESKTQYPFVLRGCDSSILCQSQILPARRLYFYVCLLLLAREVDCSPRACTNCARTLTRCGPLCSTTHFTQEIAYYYHHPGMKFCDCAA